MTMLRLAIAVSVMGTACAKAGTQSADSPTTASRSVTDTAAVRRAIDSTSQLMVAGLKRQDVTPVVDAMADDYISLESPDTVVQGKAAYRALLESMAASGKWQDVSFTSQGVVVSGDLAAEHGRWKATLLMKGGNTVRYDGNYVHVWRRGADGAWKVVRDISNTAAPGAGFPTSK